MKREQMVAVLVLALVLCALPAGAQIGTATINGAVRDSSGAVVAGANVTALNEETGITYKQKTTEAGVYAFPSIPVGSYTIIVDMQGFKTSKKTGNRLEVDTPLTVDFALEVGALTETVTVESRAEQLQTSNATIGDVVEQKAVVDLPLNGRNPLNLIILEPGVVQRSSAAAGSGIHVNGSRDRSFNVTIDGIEANESTVPAPLKNLYRLNPDNVQEYKVTTSNATAEEGRNSGASISVATRTGTNALHGTVFEFLRNEKLNSNEFFGNAMGIEKPPIKLNQYGFEAGGPIRKNKTFFFGSWSGQKINYAQPIDQAFGSVPLLYTPAALSGIYRYFVADPNTPFTLNGQRITKNSTVLVDPYTGALAPGVRNCTGAGDRNCVASYNMFANDPRHIGADPVIGKIFARYPLPNTYTYGDGLNVAGYSWNTPVQVRGPSYMARVDHTFNSNNTIFVRYLQGAQDTLGGDPNNSRPVVFPGWPPEGEVFRHTKNAAISYRRVISPRVVNELTVGISRFLYLFTQGEANPDWPNIPPFTFTNVSKPFLNRPRTFRAVTTDQVIDNLSVVKGAHMIRTGLNIRLYQHNDQRGQPGGTNVTPVLSFSQSTRAPAGFNTPAVATATAPGIEASDSTRLLNSINEILGIPAQLSQLFLGDLSHDTFLPFKAGNSVTLWSQGQRLKQYNFYVQDQWKATRNFTVNAGLRWEINMAPTEAGNRVYVPDRAIDGSQGPVTFVHADRWYKRNNIGALGPRLGLTWAPRNSTKTVVRAGYGIAFDTLPSFMITAVSGNVPGQVFSCSSVPGGATTPGCTAVPDKRIGEGFPQELPAPTVKPTSFLTAPAQLLSNAPGMITFDPNLRIPTVHQWNLSIQRELPKGFVAQVAYIGRRGTRLYRAYDLNEIDADPILPSFLIMQQNMNKNCRPDGSNCPAGVTGAVVPLVASGILTSTFVNSSTTQSDLQLNGAGNFAGRVEQTTLAAHLRPNQQFGIITYLDSGGDSYYHSAQVTVRKRFDAGLLVGLAYTLQKSIDDQSVDPVGSSSGGGLTTTTSRSPSTVRDWRQERGPSDFDRRHLVTVTSIYELPFGRGKAFLRSGPSVLRHIAGGWSVNGMYTFMSGEAFTVRSSVRTSNYSHESRAVLVGPKPQVGLYDIPGVIGPRLFNDISSFALPAPGGTGAGRNMFYGPNYWNLDLGLSKQFALTERFRLQFRMEIFNALNHPNFDDPQLATAGSGGFRSSVFSNTCCATVAPPSTQNIIDAGDAARVIQVALKLSF
jgi:hypothetical protein